MLASCQKEETGNMTVLNLFAESFQNNSNAKFAIDGTHSAWCGRDKVRINNNGEFTVNVSESQASISKSYSDPDFTTPLRAVSPASIYASDITADWIVVELPSVYEYATTTTSSGTFQHLPAPMAAYATEGDELHFKHLTGALTVKVHNSTSESIEMESISVTSDRYQLCGSKSINFTDLTNINSASTATAAQRTVTMKFPNNNRLSTGADLEVQIPVLPVGADNHFTVTIQYRHYGKYNGQHCYTRTLTQSDKDNSLARCQLGYVPMNAETSGTGVTAAYLFQENGYYIIEDRYQLELLANESANFSQAKVKLVNDVTLSGRVMAPIQNVIVFDGGGHYVKNLAITTDASGRCGLLGRIAGSGIHTALSISDLTMWNCELRPSADAQYIGTFAGYAENGTLALNNCKVKDLVSINLQANNTQTSVNIGGLVGYVNTNQNNISHCVVDNIYFNKGSYNYVATNVDLVCGGLVGTQHQGLCNISNSKVTVEYELGSGYNTVNAPDGIARFGGLVGDTYINNPSYFNLTNDTVRAGIFRVISGGVNNCYVGAWVSGTSFTGAIGNGGNVTYGAIDAYCYNTSIARTGNASNYYVCGSTEVTPSASETTSQLDLTITPHNNSK